MLLEDSYRIIIPIVIALLIIWLIYRIKNRLKLIVRDEICNNFPSVQVAISNFEHRIDYLKTLVESLERKITELENKINK